MIVIEIQERESKKIVKTLGPYHDVVTAKVVAKFFIRDNKFEKEVEAKYEYKTPAYFDK